MNLLQSYFDRPLLFYKKINRDIPLVAAILLILSASAIVYFFFPRQPNIVVINSKTNECSEKLEMVRLKKYKFTKPLLLSDIPNENAELGGIKTQINDLISKNKSLNLANSVSVYFRKLNDGSWFVINGEKGYAPASLMKITYLITLLKQAEESPGLLDKKIYFDGQHTTGFNQNIKNFTLKAKTHYTLKELLSFMIEYSDNDALNLISQNVNVIIYNRLFTDIGLPSPPMDPSKAAEYVIKVADYCKFFRILYNSGYLTDEHSDLALSMLSESTYKDGLLKNINVDFPVAHKFGERVIGQSAQLHEVGIFYAGQQPYLLGVMSEGHDLKDLSNLLAQISQIVFMEYNKGS